MSRIMRIRGRCCMVSPAAWSWWSLPKRWYVQEPHLPQSEHEFATQEPQHEPFLGGRRPLYLALQELPHGGTRAAPDIPPNLLNKKRSFITTDVDLLQEMAAALSSTDSSFPVGPVTMFCARLTSQATVSQVYQRIAESMQQKVVHTADPEAAVEALLALLKEVSARQHLHVFLDATGVSGVDPHSVLSVVLKLEAATRIRGVTLGVAVTPALLQDLCRAALTNAVEVRHTDDLQDNDAVEVKHEVLGDRGGFVVKQCGLLYGYVNWCPHVGTPLNMFPDRFWNYDKSYLLCATHGAVFHPRDGLCLGGPCAGKSLRPMPLLLANSGMMMLPFKPLSTILNAFDFL